MLDGSGSLLDFYFRPNCHDPGRLQVFNIFKSYLNNLIASIKFINLMKSMRLFNTCSRYGRNCYAGTSLDATA
jgi:hypothetical protein